MRFMSIGATAVAALLPFAGHAATLSYATSAAGPFGFGGQTLNLGQFDPFLGTLTGAEMTIAGQGSATARNTISGCPDETTCTIQTSFGIGTDVSISGLGSPVSGSANADFSCYVNQDGPGSTCPNDKSINFSFNQTFGLLASSFAAVTGSLVFDVQFYSYNAFSTFSDIGSGSLDFPEVSFGNFSASITYTYDPVAVGPEVPAVPLPAGFPLLLAGLAGLGLMARRRS